MHGGGSPSCAAAGKAGADDVGCNGGCCKSLTTTAALAASACRLNFVAGSGFSRYFEVAHGEEFYCPVLAHVRLKQSMPV